MTMAAAAIVDIFNYSFDDDDDIVADAGAAGYDDFCNHDIDGEKWRWLR
jgi:hypothetical protein